MAKYNIFKETKKEWPLWFRIKFNITTFPTWLKLKISFLLCDIKTWFKNHIEFGKYEDQFQIGVSATIHNHNPYDKENYTGDNYKHFHLWIEFGFWYIEMSINDKRYE